MKEDIQSKQVHAISALASNTELLEKAKVVLEKITKSSPQDIAQLYRLADINRQLGLHEKAVAVLHRILKIQPEERRAKTLIQALTGEHTEFTQLPNQVCPAEILLKKQFLPNDACKELLNTSLELESNFEKSSLTHGVNPEYRSSLTISESYYTNFGMFYRNKLSILLADYLKTDHQEIAEKNNIEIQMTAHGDGAYFLPHQDNTHSIKRKLTCVYYYFAEPKPFSGGDLIVYDLKDGQQNMALSFTRIIPENNLLVVFPSQFWHQVTPVGLIDNQFKNNRFSITSWLYESETR